MDGVRDSGKQPGELRRSQNWVGGTRPGKAVFVPPPPERAGALFGEMGQFIHAATDLPPLVNIALVHVQFETIHSYLVGNFRIGRLLIADCRPAGAFWFVARALEVPERLLQASSSRLLSALVECAHQRRFGRMGNFFSQR